MLALPRAAEASCRSQHLMNVGHSGRPRETSMRKSILVLLLTSIASIFAAGCASGMPNVASQFEPRVYPYVPEMGPDGPASAGEAK
jgi:hypothetical protein